MTRLSPQDDKCTTAATLVRAAEKLAPCPGWHVSAASALHHGSGDAAAAAAVRPACSLCRLPIVMSLDFRHPDGAIAAAGPEAALCYSCTVMLAVPLKPEVGVKVAV